jgi:hypothetical protein
MGLLRFAGLGILFMFHLPTAPCMVSESELSSAVESFHPLASAPTAVFESPSEPLEMARTTRSYAWQVGAKGVWVARSGRFIWIRMQTPREYKGI